MLLRSKELNLEFKALSKYLKIYDTRKRHSQLFEAGLHLKRNVSENVFITSWSLPSFANDNGFAYFCRNKSRSNRRLFRKSKRHWKDSAESFQFINVD